MTYFAKTQITLADSPNTDAFGRLRVSENNTLGSYVMDFDTESLKQDLHVISGAVGTRNANLAGLVMTVPATSGARAIRQSRRYHEYTAGQSQLIEMTFSSGAQEAGIRKRAGYFDDSNGIFFEIPETGEEPAFVIRTFTSGIPVDTRYVQSQWNMDTLDGTGPSEETLDVSKSQILQMDYQWLGAGRVRFGFNISGSWIECHNQTHSNFEPQVYMTTGRLPIRYEIENLDGSGVGTFTQICASVIREGARDDPGYQTTVRTQGFAGTNLNNDATTALLAARLRPGYERSYAEIRSFGVVPLDNKTMIFDLVLDPVVTGSFNWVDTGVGLQVAYDTLVVTGQSHCLDSIAVDANASSRTLTANVISENNIGLTSDVTGTQNVIAVIGSADTGALQQAIVKMTFLEKL